MTSPQLTRQTKNPGKALPGFFVYNSYICHMGCGEPFTVDSYTQKIQTELLKKYTFLLFPMS